MRSYHQTQISTYFKMRFNENLALRPVLMQSETWIEKPVFDRSKTGFLMQLNKRLFNSRFVAHGFQLDQTVEKTWIFKLKPQLVGFMHRKCFQVFLPHSCTSITRPHAHPTRDTTPHDNIGNAGLAAVTSVGARRELT